MDIEEILKSAEKNGYTIDRNNSNSNHDHQRLALLIHPDNTTSGGGITRLDITNISKIRDLIKNKQPFSIWENENLKAINEIIGFPYVTEQILSEFDNFLDKDDTTSANAVIDSVYMKLSQELDPSWKESFQKLIEKYNSEPEKLYSNTRTFVELLHRKISEEDFANKGLRDEVSVQDNVTIIHRTSTPRTVLNIVNSQSPTIYLTLSTLDQHIENLITKVRGQNHLSNINEKDDIIYSLKSLQEKISRITEELPYTDENISQEQANRVESKIQEFFEHVKKEKEKFLEAERLAGLVFPGTIMLLTTTIGTIFGQPVTGFLAGAWLSGKIDSSKIIREQLEK